MRHPDRTKNRRLIFSTLVLACFLAPVLPLPAHCLDVNTALASTSSKSAAAQQAQSIYGGKVLSVEEVVENARRVYRVKLLLEGGRIKIVTIESGNG